MHDNGSLARYRSFIPVRLALALLAGLLALFPAALVCADLAPGHLDTGFDPGTGANGPLYAVIHQHDGKVLIGGSFTQVNGVPRNRIARLNADGSLDTTFSPGTGANDLVYTVALQLDDKVLIGGAFTQVNGVARRRIARLNADGSLDTAFNPGTGTNDLVEAVALQPDDKVLIGGYFTQVNGVVRNRIARLNADGSLDTTFDPGTGANSWVGAVAVQPDGKVLIGGNFTLVNGVARNHIARLNANGFPDFSFDTSTGANDWVSAVALQPDGRVLIGGLFTTVDSTARNRIARLNADGSLDTSFDPGTGTNGVVNAVAVRPDGKVLVGGFFTQVNVQPRNHIARLNADGSLDTSFDAGTGPNWDVVAIVAQADGKALIGGAFTQVGSVARNRVARLNADGSLDTGFDTSAGPSGSVHAVAIQPNGKVLIGGFFSHVAGTPRNCVARLNANGTLDTAFNPGTGADSTVFAVAVQPDGKVLLGGFFTHVQGLPRNRIARLYEDGSLDGGFDPDANDTVFAVVVQPDGKVLIGGQFTQVHGIARNRVARLNADGSLDISFNPGTGASGSVYAVALQPDGKVLIGGGFVQVDGTFRRCIARLNADGSLDTSFDTSTGANNVVWAVAVQPDGKMLIAGQFTTVDSTTRDRIARLNANGSLDTSFDPGTGANDIVHAVAPQADGKVLIGGQFTQVDGTVRNHIARLHGADGSLDIGFDTSIGTNSTVHAIAAQVDGKVLVGGEFTQVNSQSREYIARLNGMTPPAFTSTAPVAATVGATYSHAFTASGFPLPTFHVTSGRLPPSLALDATSGMLAGTPSAVGTYHFTVRASNYVAPSVYHAVVLTVDEARLYLPLMVRQ